MQSNMLKHHSKRIATLTSRWSPTLNPDADKCPTTPVLVPVFMLPQTDLTTIPEDNEIHQGFLVHLCTKLHQKRRFIGLMSLSEPDKQLLRQSETTSVKY